MSQSNNAKNNISVKIQRKETFSEVGNDSTRLFSNIISRYGIWNYTTCIYRFNPKYVITTEKKVHKKAMAFFFTLPLK